MDEQMVVQFLIKEFFKGSIIFTIEPNNMRSLNWAEQENFLKATVHSELLTTYPVSSNFTKLFFKNIISQLEEFNKEVHDGFYEYLCTTMTRGQEELCCHRHYIIDNNLNNIITIKETKNMVVNGTTGMRTWEAALMLADWAICNKEVFYNKKVLELGAGTGFAGITISKFCDVHTTLLTDCHNDVLQLLQENIGINFPLFRKETNGSEIIFKSDHKYIGVTKLDWICLEMFTNDVVPDIMIGTDIVYDPSILQPLCGVLTEFFKRNHVLEVYIASVIRNTETFTLFLTELKTRKLNFEKIKHKSASLNWDSTVDWCLLRIKQPRTLSQ